MIDNQWWKSQRFSGCFRNCEMEYSCTKKHFQSFYWFGLMRWQKKSAWKTHAWMHTTEISLFWDESGFIFGKTISGDRFTCRI